MSVAMIPNSAPNARGAQLTPEGVVGNSRVTPSVLVLHGDVVSTATLLIDSMSAMIEWSVGDIVVDFTDVVFIDIASVRILDLARQLLWREGRDLTFRSPSRLAALVLGLFGLTRLIETDENPIADPAAMRVGG